EQELLVRISDLQAELCSRSNRITDLDHEIHSLNETIDTLTRELELKGKEVLRLELVNRETGFNKVFNSSANVGVINPLIKVVFTMKHKLILFCFKSRSLCEACSHYRQPSITQDALRAPSLFSLPSRLTPQSVCNTDSFLNPLLVLWVLPEASAPIPSDSRGIEAEKGKEYVLKEEDLYSLYFSF
ncbi:hypothetical protein XENOCAPTIV_001998, partial [Xenoophorus captivus]